jgi:hypothetical protein
MFSQIDKQIVRSWKEYLIEPRLAKLTGRVLRRTGPRIAVVGNCQSFGVAYAMKLLDPSATVDHYSAIGRARADMSLFARTMGTYDYVFSHKFPQGHINNGDSDELRRRVSKTVLFPAITFAAFHPDLVYLLDATRGNAQLFGPLGPYHSALAVFAFRKGLTLEEANALYNRNVFEALGYFDVWNDAAEEFLESSKQKFGMDLSVELMNWSRRGVFMYSSVHPKPYVLADIATRLFERVGLKVREDNLDHYTIDDLARAEIFPIYPSIGEMYGARGGYLFKMGNFHVSNGVGDFLNLPQYLSACYKIYQAAASTQMAHQRIDNWLSDDATSDYLVRLARENLRAGLTPTL